MVNERYELRLASAPTQALLKTTYILMASSSPIEQPGVPKALLKTILCDGERS